MTKERVIFLISSSIAGGGQIYLFNLINYIKKDYSVMLICPKGFLSEKVSNIGIDVICMDINYKTSRNIKEIILHEKLTYGHVFVNAHLLGTALWCAIALKNVDGVRLVMTAHNQVTNESSSLLKKIAYPLILKYISKRVNAFIAVSQDIANRVTEITNSECTYIQSSVPLRLPPIEIRLFNNSTEKIVFGFVGRLSSLKNPLRFVQVAKCITEVQPQSRFVIIGDGEMRPEVEAIIKKEGLNDYFDLKGFVDKPLDEMAKLDVMIITSDSEGTPLALLEAMSIGLPVVSTRVGGIPTVIDDGKDGLLADVSASSLAECAIRVTSDEQLYSTISKNCRKKIEEQYSYKKNIGKYMSILRG